MSNQSLNSHILGTHLAKKQKPQAEEQSEIRDSDITDAVINTQIIGETVEAQELISLEGMETDKKFCEFRFLKRVLLEELGDKICSEYNVLVVAIHSVFLESGLVGYDSELGFRNDRLYIMEEGPSKAFTMSLYYTVPQLLDNEDLADSIVLKFQSLGRFVNIYGSLAMGGNEFYRVCLDEYKFGPIVNLVRLNCGEKNGWYSEKGISEFMTIVKDGLVWPLLIDLCYKAGLALPSCFMALPSELKLKILELLPAVDLARAGCACSELRTLSSGNDLWRQKFAKEFSSGTGAKGILNFNWKQQFSYYMEIRKKLELQKRLHLHPVSSVKRAHYSPRLSYRFPYLFRHVDYMS